MIVTMQFELPEEDENYKCAVLGTRYRTALDDFRLWLRDQRKYNSQLTADMFTFADKAWQALHDILTDLEINLD